MKAIFLSVDPKVWYLIAAGFLVLFIFSLIKKAVKLSITILIVMILFLFFGPQSIKVRERYNIQVKQEILIVTIDGQKTEVQLKDLDKISFEKRVEEKYLTFHYKEKESESMLIPNFMEKITTKMVEELNHQLTEKISNKQGGN